MKKWMMTVSSILLVLALAAGCGAANKNEGGAAEQPTPAEQGGQAGGAAGGGGEAQKIFQANCTSCHGQNLEGGVGPNLTKVGGKYKSADEIKTIILKGRNGMPGGLVSETDAKALSDWLITKK
ncbi:c-type cytochrome [Aneurinibacillus migulanus]|uniref:c-type cytochrome n=1 Tax=Aneurinibacillus migulanus TaxID=47500 RepID=UPI00209DD2A6|nr:cytochrome c [Aneurinibacillus migulanus]MCP1357570.1 cytochrome c [Aneurinibacillus migulanus]